MARSLRRALGLPTMPEIVEDSLCPQCNATMRSDGVHARSCITSGLITARHHQVVVTLMAAIRAAGCRGVAMESSENFLAGAQGRGGGQLRMDIVIPAGELGRKAVLIDVTVVDPSLPSHSRLGETGTGKVAVLAERKKRTKYMGHFDPTTSTRLAKYAYAFRVKYAV